MSDNYEMAVQWVEWWLGRFIKEGQFTFPSIDPRVPSLMLDHDIIWLPESYAMPRGLHTGYHFTTEGLAKLIVKAQKDYAAFGLAKRVLSDVLINERELGPFAVAVGLFLSGAIEEPKGASRRSRNWALQSYIYQACRRCEVTYELKLTRNDASDHERSAVDAVSLALGRLGMNEPSVAVIKAICVGRKYAKLRGDHDSLDRAQAESRARNPLIKAYMEWEHSCVNPQN